jgi:hypothetical protein
MRQWLNFITKSGSKSLYYWFLIGTSLVISILFSYCDPYTLMVERYDNNEIEIKLSEIEISNDSLNFNLNIYFPPKYYRNCAFFKIIPTIYDTIEKKSIYKLDTIMIYSERYKTRDQKINYQYGGTANKKYKIIYFPNYKSCCLLIDSKLIYCDYEINLKQRNVKLPIK